jgi:hypothetical protein
MNKDKLNSNDRYLVIRSTGEIEMDSFMILGGSTKRDDKDKIGRFGSGLKYAIATLLRMDVEFTIFSGKLTIPFKKKTKRFRDKHFDMILINGKETNFSTDMGPDWSYYESIREIYSNAKDEGITAFETTDGFYGIEGQTSIYIKMDDGVKDLIDNFEYYFSFYRNDIINEYPDSDDLSYKYRGVKVFKSKGHLIIYKDGFRVHENKRKKSLFNYDIPSVIINESREISSFYLVEWDIASLLGMHPNDEMMEMIVNELKKIDEDNDSDIFEINMDWDFSDGFHKEWDKYIGDYDVSPMEMRGFSQGYVSDRNIYAPSSFIKTASKSGLSTNFIGIKSKLCPWSYADGEMNSGDYSILLEMKSILYSFDVDADIQKVHFMEDVVDASFDLRSGKKILLSCNLWEKEDECISSLLSIIPILDKKGAVEPSASNHVKELSKFTYKILQKQMVTK